MANETNSSERHALRHLWRTGAAGLLVLAACTPQGPESADTTVPANFVTPTAELPGNLPGPAPTEIPVTVATTPETTAAVPPGPFDLTGDPAKDAAISWFQQEHDSVGVQVSTTPLELPFPIEQSVGSNYAEGAKALTGAEFLAGFQAQSGLLVNLYRGNLQKEGLAENGMPDVTVDPKEVAITLDYVFSHARAANSGYLNEQELQKIEGWNATGGLANNRLDVIFVNRGPLCAEDIYPDAPDPLSACVSYGGTKLEWQEFPSRTGVIIVRVPDDYVAPASMDRPSQLAYQSMMMSSTELAHEFGHMAAIMSGASFRHAAEALQASQNPDGSIDEAKRVELYNKLGIDEHDQFVTQLGLDMLQDLEVHSTVTPATKPYVGYITQVGLPPMENLPVTIHS